MDYTQAMLTVERTEVFHRWLVSLKDRLAQKQILARLERLAEGH